MESNFLEKYFGSWIEGKPPKDKAVLVYDSEHDEISFGTVRDESKFGGTCYLEPLGLMICGHHESQECNVEYEDVTHWMPVRRPETPNG